MELLSGENFVPRRRRRSSVSNNRTLPRDHELIDSIGYSVVDAGPLADSWRQATGTPVWGTPYGPYSDEKGQPAGEDAIRAALATATR